MVHRRATDVTHYRHRRATDTNMPFLVAIVVLSICGVITVAVLTIVRPERDNAALFATVVSFIAPTTLALLGLLNEGRRRENQKAAARDEDAAIDAAPRTNRRA